ncbi:DUF342 domain-containing protein [Alkalihalophilus sp. As8PL]|uniref:DUF342 domain-containing protein n=1 Tax=Alkalihalophilus sp. As8PL TaxID=3237103 RepID=A0AB39BSD6_9BACI
MIDLDQYYQITITSNKMEATVVQHAKTNQEETIDIGQVKEWVHEHGIVFGMIEESLHSLSNRVNLDSPLLIARGLPKKQGAAAYLLPILFKKEKVADDGKMKVNLKDVLDIESVREGDKVGQKIAATSGQNGKNVLGEEISAKPGKDFTLRAGKNTRVSEDEQSIYSLIDGQVSIENKRIHVHPIYEVKGDLSMKTGNISFVGNVVINGNVPTGFIVEADGDIRVRGTVEGAHLTAGGSIFVGAGIVGQHKSFLKAKGDLQTTFINEGNVEVGGTIEVAQAILHSTCTAEKTIICTRGKGNIVGGVLSAGEGVHARTIGNDMQTKTSLFIGANEQLLKKQKDTESTKRKAQDDLTKLGKLLKVYIEKQKKQSLVGKEKIMVLRIQHSFRTAKELLDESNDILESLDKLGGPLEGGSISAKDSFYPNVFIHFGKYRRKLVSKHQYAKVTLIDSEITISSL